MSLNPADFENIEPESMEWLPDGDMEIVWPGGHRSTYTQAYLRAKCPCANCQDIHSHASTRIDEDGKNKAKKKPFIILNGPKPPPIEVAQSVKAVIPMGHYAIRFTWGDQHDAGIYSFRYLRAICPCATCATDAS